MTALVQRDTLNVSERAVVATPMEMLSAAIERGAGMDVLEKLMGLQERWEANQARKAFDAAISSAKAEIPVVLTNREGHNNKRYADFAAIARAVDPVMAKHGLAYRFRTRQENGAIHVTCIISHRDGHSEETTLAGAADTSGNKNAIQALGSTLTYLQRYSLRQALGIAASDDDDGRSAGAGETVSDEQYAKLQTALLNSGADESKFLAFYKIESLNDLPARQYDAAMRMLAQKAKTK